MIWDNHIIILLNGISGWPCVHINPKLVKVRFTSRITLRNYTRKLLEISGIISVVKCACNQMTSTTINSPHNFTMIFFINSGEWMLSASNKTSNNEKPVCIHVKFTFACQFHSISLLIIWLSNNPDKSID